MSHVLTVINDYEIQAVGPALALVLSHIISSQRSLLSRVAELSADPEHCVFRAALDEASALETGRNTRRPPKAPWKWRSKVKLCFMATVLFVVARVIGAGQMI